MIYVEIIIFILWILQSFQGSVCVFASESDFLPPPFGALGADTKAHALPLSYTATEGGGFVWAALELKRWFLDSQATISPHLIEVSGPISEMFTA